MDKRNLSNTTNQQLWVGKLSDSDKQKIHKASKITGLRRSEFYRRAIIEKAQSVLSSTSKDNISDTGASSDRGGASFCDEE